MKVVLFLATFLFYTITLSANETYKKICSACHQWNGEGVEGTFPPLKGWVNQLAKTQPGREYLILVVSYGLNNEIQIHNQSYIGYMPPNPQLSHEELANLLNYLTLELSKDSLTQPFSAEEVKKIRKPGITMGDVLKYRKVAIQSLPQ